MHLQQLIRTVLFAGCIFFSFKSSGQRDSINYIRSPYRAEYTPHYTLGVFKRGFSTDSLKVALDSLETKDRKSWSHLDSLNFARISLRTGNLELSEYYFDHLKVEPELAESYWYDHLMIHYLKKEYDKGLAEINLESPMIIEFSRVYFFKKIFEAQILQKADPKWYETNVVFGWTTDTLLLSMDRRSAEFKQAVTEPLRNLETTLRYIIAYVHDKDPVLAAACREMGHIIYGYFNLSHAFIAYSMAHHYNKKDKPIMEEMSYLKSRLNQKKYKVPNFRKYFPRVQKGRFEYEVLKERILLAQKDTNVYMVPATMKEKEKPLLSFPHQYIVLGGLVALILMLALLLKGKKR